MSSDFWITLGLVLLAFAIGFLVPHAAWTAWVEDKTCVVRIDSGAIAIPCADCVIGKEVHEPKA